MTFRASKVPNNELALTNRISANPNSLQQHSHIQISTDAGVFVFTVEATTATSPGDLGFSELQRKWAMLEMNNQYRVNPYRFDHSQYLAAITLEVSFYISTKTTQEPYDTAQMAQLFLQNLAAGGQAFSLGQPLIFAFKSKPVLRLTVKDMVAVDLEAMQRNVQGQKKKPKDNVGLSQPNMQVLFEKSGTSPLVLVGDALASVPQRSIINPEFDFGKMGIGGLDKEFSGIFRRAFASRVFPANIATQLGLKHVRGILLFGPPGTGKTLMARQIGKMLNTREPKIVSGPQVLDKYVGESEANIRKLFAEAEDEQKKLGLHSGLHIIIFDEIDAICKARGSVAGAAGVHDSMVNQLLAKMDGVDQLDNVLVIGMTNRRDMIDEALLRPGRFEVQMEIGLPDEHGRVQILTIHTSKMREANRLAPDVDLKYLAKNTKNFSGAELEGLVRAATSLAMYRCIKATSKVEVDEAAMQNLRVDAADFQNALENDVKPAFGAAEERLESMARHGIIEWGQPVRDVLETGAVLCEQAKTSSLVSVLLRGPPNSGKTALAARICMDSEFPFIKVCSPDDTLGYSESSKVLAIKKLFDDAYRSKLSCILVDDIERLIEYGAIGPRYSNACLHVLLVLLKKEPPKDRHLLIVGTTSCPDVMRALGVSSAFKNELHVDQLTNSEQLIDAVRKVDIFDERELSNIAQQLRGQRLRIGIKKLLALTEMVRKVEPRERVTRFMQRLHEDGISPVGYGDNDMIGGGGEVVDNMMTNHNLG